MTMPYSIQSEVMQPRVFVDTRQVVDRIDICKAYGFLSVSLDASDARMNSVDFAYFSLNGRLCLVEEFRRCDALALSQSMEDPILANEIMSLLFDLLCLSDLMEHLHDSPGKETQTEVMFAVLGELLSVEREFDSVPQQVAPHTGKLYLAQQRVDEDDMKHIHPGNVAADCDAAIHYSQRTKYFLQKVSQQYIQFIAEVAIEHIQLLCRYPIAVARNFFGLPSKNAREEEDQCELHHGVHSDDDHYLHQPPPSSPLTEMSHLLAIVSTPRHSAAFGDPIGIDMRGEMSPCFGGIGGSGIYRYQAATTLQSLGDPFLERALLEGSVQLMFYLIKSMFRSSAKRAIARNAVKDTWPGLGHPMLHPRIRFSIIKAAGRMNQYRQRLFTKVLLCLSQSVYVPASWRSNIKAAYLPSCPDDPSEFLIRDDSLLIAVVGSFLESEVQSWSHSEIPGEGVVGHFGSCYVLPRLMRERLCSVMAASWSSRTSNDDVYDMTQHSSKLNDFEEVIGEGIGNPVERLWIASEQLGNPKTRIKDGTSPMAVSKRAERRAAKTLTEAEKQSHLHACQMQLEKYILDVVQKRRGPRHKKGAFSSSGDVGLCV